jgi:hypothetical protein
VSISLFLAIPFSVNKFSTSSHVFIFTDVYDIPLKYEGESNENRKTEIKIRNIAPLSYKLADMLPI